MLLWILNRFLFNEDLFVGNGAAPGAVGFGKGDVVGDVAEAFVCTPDAVGCAEGYGRNVVGVEVAGFDHGGANACGVCTGGSAFEQARTFAEPVGSLGGGVSMPIGHVVGGDGPGRSAA